MATAFAACGNGTDGSPADDEEAGILRVATSMALTTWDPRAAGSNEPIFLSNVYEPLLYTNPPGSDEPFTPCLATSWSVSDDGLTWTFDLREGVTFHDGTPFTSAAVEYSIEATRDLGLGSAYIWFPVTKIATPDDLTVKITTEYPVPVDRCASSMYGAWMFSPKTKGKSSEWWDEPNEAGTGPYKLVSYSPNEEVVFERDPQYWGGWAEGQFDQVVVKQVADAQTQRMMLEAGEVDFADNLSRDIVPSLEDNSDLKIVRMPTVMNEMLAFNTQRKPLDDVKVRQALSYALPYDDILSLATNGYGEVSKGALPASLYPHDPDCPQYTYDLEKAKRLLAEAGYPDGGFTLLFTYASDYIYAPKFALQVKEAFAKLGVTVDLRPMLGEQAWEKGKGPVGGRQDIYELYFWPGFPDGYDSLYAAFHSEAEPFWNMSYWYNADFDALIDTAFSEEVLDPEKAQGLYDQAQALLVEEAPAAYLFDPDMVYGMNPALTLEPTALNSNYTNVLYFYRVSR